MDWHQNIQFWPHSNYSPRTAGLIQSRPNKSAASQWGFKSRSVTSFRAAGLVGAAPAFRTSAIRSPCGFY
jgi:hypothetical protein